MLGILGRLFGSPDAVSTIVSKAADGIDALVYTDEEKAGDAAKARSEARSMVVKWMAATSGQNLARRLIALAITGIWLSMYLLAVLCNMAAVWITSKEDQLAATAQIAFDAAADMNPAVMLILAFYFAAPHMGDIATAAINKMGGSSTPDRQG